MLLMVKFKVQVRAHRGRRAVRGAERFQQDGGTPFFHMLSAGVTSEGATAKDDRFSVRRQCDCSCACAVACLHPHNSISNVVAVRDGS